MTDLHKAAQQALEALKSVQDHRPNDETSAAITALRAALAAQPAPIDMVLHCPKCGVQHIDAPEGRILYADEPIDDQSYTPLWANPPHRTHLCHGCGHKWRPADVPTNGVAAVKTRGKDDSPIAAQPEPAAIELHDFVKHRTSWRKALSNLAEQDDSGYWPHELSAFDKAMCSFDRAVLAAAPTPPAPTGPSNQLSGNSGKLNLMAAPTGLTDAEIDDLSRTMVKGHKSVNWLCRAIEAAHGIQPPKEGA